MPLLYSDVFALSHRRMPVLRSATRIRAWRIGAFVPFRFHAGRQSFARKRGFVFAPERRVFHVKGNRVATLVEIHGPDVFQTLARTAGLERGMIVRPVPGEHAQAFFRDPEVLMEPVAAHWGGRYEAAIVVILAQDLVCAARCPGLRAQRIGPS